MAALFYAYLPAFMKQFYEGIGGEFPGFEKMTSWFLRGMARSEIEVFRSEVGRLIDSSYTDEELLEKLWTFGARDFPGGGIRASLVEVRAILTRHLEDEPTTRH